MPSVVYTAVVYFMVNESPRWLLLKGRRVEAIEAIRKMTGAGGDITINSSFSNMAFMVEPDGSGLFLFNDFIYIF